MFAVENGVQVDPISVPVGQMLDELKVELEFLGCRARNLDSGWNRSGGDVPAHYVLLTVSILCCTNNISSLRPPTLLRYVCL